MIKLAAELKSGDVFTATDLPERCTVKKVATNGRRVTITYAAKGTKKTCTLEATDRVTICEPTKTNRPQPLTYTEQLRAANRRFRDR